VGPFSSSGPKDCCPHNVGFTWTTHTHTHTHSLSLCPSQSALAMPVLMAVIACALKEKVIWLIRAAGQTHLMAAWYWTSAFPYRPPVKPPVLPTVKPTCQPSTDVLNSLNAGPIQSEWSMFKMKMEKKMCVCVHCWDSYLQWQKRCHMPPRCWCVLCLAG